jgi:asparagine synthase (glutamine-hydrolysing)
MEHRGPDDAGIWVSSDGKVILGHRRLAIIDLSPGGHQPMSDANERLWIVFNGELYNYKELRRELEKRGYRFLTASDTEVILNAYHAWGTDCLTHLNGMFAFGLYDTDTQQLFIARDRAGEKPLFYSHVAKRVVFASELKAFMTDPTFPRQLDLEGLNEYLAYGYVTGDKCILKRVRKLPPGQAAIYNYDTDILRVWQYWHLPEQSSHLNSSSEELSDRLEVLLMDSVRRQLVADVPVGVLLSGGIDSSLIVAFASKISTTPVNTFTITFPGHGKYDESKYARLVSQYFGTKHTELVAEPGTIELLPKLARQYDEPVADTSIIPSYMVSQLTIQHVKVALGGDGGDELFGGYPHYSWILYLDFARRFVPNWLRTCMGTVATRMLPIGIHGRNYITGFCDDLSNTISNVNLIFDQMTRKRLLKPISRNLNWSSDTPKMYRASLCMSNYSSLRQATESDFRTIMADDFLVKVDRASMLNSLEIRAPFLDYRIIEFAFKEVPDILKVFRSERKILLRILAKSNLPSTLDLKRKQGFIIPFANWFKDGEWGNYIETVLNESDPDLFDHKIIQKLLKGQRYGLDNTRRLFALTMFELWRKEYNVTI